MAKLELAQGPARGESRPGLELERFTRAAPDIPSLTEPLVSDVWDVTFDDSFDHTFAGFESAASAEDSQLVDDLAEWMACQDKPSQSLLQQLHIEPLVTERPPTTVPTLRIPTLEGAFVDAAPPARPSGSATAAEKRNYRARVAIPRYLRKKGARCWERRVIHESRSAAAFRRPRKIGKFHRTAPQFVSVSVMQDRSSK